MGQQWDQGRNQKISWNKLKWGHNNPNTVGHWESNPERENHSITGLSEKQEKSSNKQSSFIIKGPWKITINKAQNEWMEGNSKDQSRNKWNRV